MIDDLLALAAEKQAIYKKMKKLVLKNLNWM